MENNLEQLKKLAKIFNSDKVITTDEIQQVLAGIVQIMNSFKKGNEQLNAETKQIVETLFNKILVEHDKLVSQVTDTTEKTKKEVDNKLLKTVSEIKSLMEEVKAMKPIDGKDGKDADEEIIVDKVLEKIKLPEATILDTPEELRDKLETLTGNDRLDAKAIKNLPKMVQNYIGGSAGNIKEIVAGTGVTVDNSVPGYPTISASISTGSSDTQVLFNKLGVITGNADMVFDYTNKTLKVGGGTPTYTLDSALAFISTRSVDGYYSTSIQNLSTDTSASTDIILNNNAATDDINYLDIGIASSTNTDPLYTIAGAGQAYIYNQSESLAIGTATSGKVIKFHTGGTLAANEGARLDGGLFSVGLNATTLGQLKLYGNTSGSVTLQPNAVAGTNIVLTLPATTGTVALTSNILDEKVKYDAGDPTAGYVADKIIAGTGISVAEGTGGNENKLQITNSAPDQTVAIASGTGISVTGTYPNFTVTNSSPDQTVVLTAGTNITSITGTYPNFTINADTQAGTYTDEKAQDAVGNAIGNGLDYDDATGAISVDETELAHNSLGSKQGGTTNEYYHLTSAQATIATQSATTDRSGYLTDTDWDTFNGKAAGTHAAQHAVGQADAVFPADPGADKFLKWNNTSNAIEWADASAGSGATTALDNLASVAINTTLVSDTDNTDALGTAAIGWSDLFLGSGAVITWSTAPSTADVTLTHSANTLTLAGGDLALGANNLTLTGSIASTGSRVTKGWFTDLECTNAIAGSITGSAATLTTTRTLWGQNFNGSANVTGDITLGASNITMTGSIAATANRVTKLWATDIESTNMPTVGGTAILTSLTAPQFTTIELGHASDTTLSRSAAGVLAVEGKNVLVNDAGVVNIAGSSTTAGTLKIFEDTDDGTNSVSIKAPTLAGDYTLTLPTTDGDANQVLTTNGSGVLSWTTPAGGIWVSVSGTRASDTTFTVSGDQTAIFKKGLIVRWQESGVDKVGMVSIPSTYSSPNTTITIIGDTCASIDSNSFKYSTILGAEQFIKNFAVAGNIAVGTDIANKYYATEPMRLIGVDLQAGTAGTTNTLTIDLNKNGTSFMSTKATLATTVASSTTPFTADSGTALALGDYVTIDCDATQTTLPIDLYIQLYQIPTRYLSLS